MANRFTLYNKQGYNSMFTPENLDFQNQVLVSKQHQYDTAEATSEDLNDMFLKVPALQQDRTIRDNKLQQYQTELQDKLNKYGQDYSQLAPWLKQKTKEIKQDLTYGILGKIAQQYNNAQQYTKDIQDRYEKGDIDSEKRDKLLSISHDQYKGVANNQSFNGITPAKNINIPEEATKLANDWKADAKSKGLFNDNTGQYFVKETGEWVNPDEVYNYILPALQSRPDIQAHLNQNHLLNTYGKSQQDFLTQDSSGKIVPLNTEYLYKQKPLEEAVRLAAAKEGYNKQDEDFYNNRQFDLDAKAAKEAKSTNIPVYDVPGQGTQKLDIDFDKFTTNSGALSIKPYKEGDYRGTGLPIDLNLEAGKKIIPPQNLPDKEKKLFEGFIKSFYPQMSDKLKKDDGKTNWKPFYDTLNNNKDKIIKAASITNNQVRGISPDEEKEIKAHYSEKTLADLGTAGFSSATYYDMKNGKELTYKEFQDQLSGEDKKTPVNITQKLHRNNGIGLVTGNDKYTDGNIITINGKSFVQSSPKYYEGPLNNELQLNRAVNKVNNTKFNPINGGVVDVDLSNIDLGTVPIKTTTETNSDGSENVTYYLGDKAYNSPEEVIAALKYLNTKK